jgi:transcriptional regulator with XRE-family HTH domain
MDHTRAVSKRFTKVLLTLISRKTPGAKSILQIAESIGVAPSNLSAIKHGNRNPTIGMVCDVCIHFDVNPSWILLGVGKMFTESTKIIHHPVNEPQ